MIQRWLYQVLKAGVERNTADTERLYDFFETEFGLDEEELAAIVDYWKAKPPAVHHGYAPRDIDAPVYSIVLENEAETENWFHDEVGPIDDPEDEHYRDEQYGQIWRHQYGILVYAEHPDVTAYYYEVAKSIIMGGNDFFIGQGLFDINISGADLAPDPRYIPEHLFARRMTFSCQRPFIRTDYGSALGKFTRIDGIHIDSSGSPRDAGPVKTNLTCPDEGES